MGPLKLENQTEEGQLLQAIFLPEKGMNLISFKRGDLEVIDQSTWNLFEERYAGVGALIGPHFYRRRPEIIPKINDESLFPHIARVKAHGSEDPFSHGIARYAPWKVEATSTQVRASLSGKDEWNGMSLAALEGQNFNFTLDAQLKKNGLFLQLGIVSDTDSVVGIHYYYALPKGRGRVVSQVQDHYMVKGEMKSIPAEWKMDVQKLAFTLNQEADYTFHPYSPTEAQILLETSDYVLKTKYECANAENCWQLYHPQDGSFVCIEPLSAKDPRHPHLTVSSLNIHLEILPGI